MFIAPPASLQKSLAAKLLIMVFSVYVVIAVVVTAAHMITDYFHTRDSLIKELVLSNKTFEPSLSRLAWNVDMDGIRNLMGGIIELPAIIGVRVNVTGVGVEQLGIVGLGAKDIHFTREQGLSEPVVILDEAGGDLFSYHFPLYYALKGGGKEFVGEAVLYSNRSVVLDRLKVGFTFLIVNAVIKTVALWIIVLWVGRKLITQPLKALTSATQELSLENLDQAKANLGNVQGDELGDLEAAFNAMVDKLRHSIRERDRVSEDLAASERRFKELFENSPVALWDEDFTEVQNFLDNLRASGVDDLNEYLDQHPEDVAKSAELVKINDLNQAVLSLHHSHSKSELMANLANTFIPESYAAFRLELMAMWNGVEDLEFEGWVKTLDGEKLCVTLRWAVVPGEDEKMSRILVSLVDISKRKQAEEELAQHRDHLQELVHERTQELKLARDSAVRANKTKSEFLSCMSHELRTPLNAIIGYSGTINEQIFGPLQNEKYAEYVEDIHASGQHLLQLINDILDVSSIEAGKVELEEEEISVHTIMEDVLMLVQPRANIGQVSLVSEVDADLPSVWADERRLKQILINLMSNAVKFTPEGGTVTLSAELVPRGCLAITVADTGVGMDEEGIEKAMTRFGQVDSQLNRKHEGTGLGLPLAKSLVVLHQGRFHIESEKGKGTMITVTLPSHRVIEGTLKAE